MRRYLFWAVVVGEAVTVAVDAWLWRRRGIHR